MLQGYWWTYILVVSLLSCPILCDPTDCTCQVPLSVEFPRQEYWSRLPFPIPGDLPDPGIELTSPASPALAGGFFTTTPLGKPFLCVCVKLRL